jgi:hypothetical protein
VIAGEERLYLAAPGISPSGVRRRAAPFIIKVVELELATKIARTCFPVFFLKLSKCFSMSRQV